MDYGYQLLRHVVQQVFGNLGQAARLTLLLTILPYALTVALVTSLAGPDLMAMDQTAPGYHEEVERFEAYLLENAGTVLLYVLLLLAVSVISYAWAAVGWHRYVLLEERGGLLLPNWNWSFVGRYLWAAFRIFVIILLIAVAFSVLSVVIRAFTESPSIFGFLSLGVTIGFLWVVTRIGLILPSAALGKPMGLGESWSLTRPVSGAILLPIIVIPIVFALLNGVLQFVPLIGLVLVFFVLWLQLLVNLALMTTLYGNLVEGRALN
ncbi:hypothetical protein [Boseongicola sp. H5]|uniref:hypothetical protein n=1 Tax=Rhodobacterales TaxID=204455 RepID=UPI001AFD4FC6|nr:hypothetical protein [Boseongicola sp. H5]MBO6601642.1 hypothetical protein [Roseicyclus sp.]MBO6623474.1 hypothetical protein [Roseicyclus sp.]MBO6920810.1 hypothetical protein [Roseicyclus sp.]